MSLGGGVGAGRAGVGSERAGVGRSLLVAAAKAAVMY